MNGDKTVDDNYAAWEPQQDWFNGRQRSAAVDRDSTYTCLVELSKQVRVRHGSTPLARSHGLLFVL